MRSAVSTLCVFVWGSRCGVRACVRACVGGCDDHSCNPSKLIFQYTQMTSVHVAFPLEYNLLLDKSRFEHGTLHLSMCKLYSDLIHVATI